MVIEYKNEKITLTPAQHRELLRLAKNDNKSLYTGKVIDGAFTTRQDANESRICDALREKGLIEAVPCGSAYGARHVLSIKGSEFAYALLQKEVRRLEKELHNAKNS